MDARDARDTRDEWRFREDRVSGRGEADRDADWRAREDRQRDDFYRQDTYRETHQPGRFEQRGDRMLDDRAREQRTERARIYGTAEPARTPMALGIMHSEATQADLTTRTSGTTYTQGIKIDRVHEEMPAATAGLQKGDVIVDVDGRTPATITVLRERLLERDPGDSSKLKVLRNGEEQDITIRVEEVDSRKYNWDFMENMRTIDQGGLDTIDQGLLQPPNRQEIYRPSQEGTRDPGPPLWDRMRDSVDKTINPRR